MNAFLAPDKYKVSLAVALVFLAPFPFYIGAGAGFAPPVIFLCAIAIFPNPIVRLLSLAVLFIYTILAYLLACGTIRLIYRYVQDEAYRLIAVSFAIATLLCSSFFHIYWIADAGGGSHTGNIFDGLRSCYTQVVDELHRPAPPHVKVEITPVGEDGIAEKLCFKVNEPMLFKITLLSTADQMTKIDVGSVMHGRVILATRGGELQGSPRFEFLPAREERGDTRLPYNVPVFVGSARLQLPVSPGRYRCTLQRTVLPLQPTTNADAQRNLHAELEWFSNTVTLEVVR
jgi:hypothetical protein